jgi:hypothetical protein
LLLKQKQNKIDLVFLTVLFCLYVILLDVRVVAVVERDVVVVDGGLVVVVGGIVVGRDVVVVDGGLVVVAGGIVVGSSQANFNTWEQGKSLYLSFATFWTQRSTTPPELFGSPEFHGKLEGNATPLTCTNVLGFVIFSISFMPTHSDSLAVAFIKYSASSLELNVTKFFLHALHWFDAEIQSNLTSVVM